MNHENNFLSRRNLKNVKKIIDENKVAIRLAVFEVRRKSLNTFLGWTWGLINPILQVLIVLFIMTFIAKSQITNLPIWLLANMATWLFMQASILKTSNSYIHRRGLIQNSDIEMKSLVKADVLSELFVVLPFYFLALLLSLTSGKVTNVLLFAPAVILIVFVFAYGVGLIVAPLTVWFRDLPYVLGLILQVVFWMTPIAYARLELNGPLRVLIDFNPLTYILELTQNVFYKQEIRPQIFFVALGISVATLFIGELLAKKSARQAAVYL